MGEAPVCFAEPVFDREGTREVSLLALLRMGPWLAILLLLGVVSYQSDKIHDWHQQSDKCAEARKADRKSYEDTQRIAAEQNKADVARKEAEQKAINNDQISNLNARLELLRRELRKASPAAPGSAGSTRPPQAGSGPATPGETGLCLAPEELLRGAENEERHDQLITVVERLMKLLNAAPSPSSSE